ncbi:uncharacterized protein BT62DRAFT_933752 [Guyanagaster necrorhizus]|uniref:Uncharacterized protein n=1 Tax=Guyanagaster necrorhizus TaxID=856835 RepID=A0A9P7VQQ6_9AGAR|nr:uncharacterized protein BT62DRAFT_933752 [Guyanagaster necrorhizus MCA 3950]KAG7444705.1 hypothetical protein BT62DRAFT_933752 [Guyanagaster necrorhizus MCA 3950]
MGFVLIPIRKPRLYQQEALSNGNKPGIAELARFIDKVKRDTVIFKEELEMVSRETEILRLDVTRLKEETEGLKRDIESLERRNKQGDEDLQLLIDGLEHAMKRKIEGRGQETDAMKCSSSRGEI